MKRFWTWARGAAREVVTGALAIGLAAAAASLWHRAIWHGLTSAWSWLGASGSVRHWLILLLISLAVAGAASVAWVWWLARLQHRAAPPEPRPVAEAEAFRDAYECFLDAFLGWRDDVYFKGVPVQDAWQDEYRRLRRTALDAFRPIREPLREWFRRIDEYWTRSWPGEPVWREIDGPDDSIESIIDKFLRPLTLPDAIEFWDGFIPGKLHDIAEQRIDLLDDFVRMLREPPVPDIVFRRPTRLARLRSRLRRRRKVAR